MVDEPLKATETNFIPLDQERAVEVLTRYAKLASTDFILGVLLASSDTPLISILEAELERRLQRLGLVPFADLHHAR